MDFASSTRAAEDRITRKLIYVKSSVVLNEIIGFWDRLD